MENSVEKKERILYFDVIRVIAIYALVCRHMLFIDITDSYEGWIVSSFYKCINPWIIPILLMLSGAIFLDNKKDATIKSLYSNNIKKMLIYFFVWSAIYAFFRFCLNMTFTAEDLIDKKYTLDDLIKFYLGGYFHLWYIPYAIAMYMMTPLLKCATKDKSTYIYICFVIGLYSMLYYLSWHNIINIPFFYLAGNYGFISLYVFMFLIGGLLHKYDINKKTRIFIYVLGIASTIAICVGTYILTTNDGAANEILQYPDCPLAIIQGIAIYVFIKEKFKNNNLGERKTKVLTYLSNASFGVYMVHPIIMYLLGYPGDSVPSVYYSPLIGLGVLFLCYVASFIIKKIPLIGKYII